MPGHKSIAWTRSLCALQLAFSSVALVAPIVMLRRYRRDVVARNLQEAPVPPRRGRAPSMAPLHSSSPPIRSRPALQITPRQIPDRHQSPLKVPVSNKDNGEQFFNAPLYTLKAFGIATALVTVGATASILGAMKALNARDVRLFIP